MLAFYSPNPDDLWPDVQIAPAPVWTTGPTPNDTEDQDNLYFWTTE